MRLYIAQENDLNPKYIKHPHQDLRNSGANIIAQ